MKTVCYFKRYEMQNMDDYEKFATGLLIVLGALIIGGINGNAYCARK